MPTQIWFVRAGRGGFIVDDFLSENMVGIGWLDLGLVESNSDRQELIQLGARAYPGAKPGTITHAVSQVLRFTREPSVGDAVMTYAPADRRYYIGTIESEATFNDAGDDHSCRRRTVSWRQQVSRDALSAKAKNTLGSILTLFRVEGEVAEEVIRLARPMGDEQPAEAPSSPPQDNMTPADSGEDPDVFDFSETLLQRAQDAIEDKLNALSWDDMERLFTGILRAMGYRARRTGAGSDRGVDIFASRDGLGLEEPRIFVEVKHRKGKMGAPAIRAFLGGRNPSDRCLYVSTGGFTNEAKYEAERSSTPIRVLALPDVRELLLEHYESLDTETQALIPLRRAYLPTE